MIELSRVTKTVVLPNGERLTVLADASLEINDGEVVAIVGRSGSGKTTLLNILGLLDPFDSGTYVVDGRLAAGLSDAEASRLRGQTFGFVFQQFHLLERRTALQNVMSPLQHATARDFKTGRAAAGELLELVGLADRVDSFPSQLSGGEQQRVAIARSLIRSPRYVLADEPTGSLDWTTGQKVWDLLVELVKARGGALVAVTHDEQLARRAKRRLLIAEGQVQPIP